MTYRCAYCGITTDGYSNHVHTCASAPWLKMPNDDPCDALPDEHAQWLWGRVMLDRETDPDARRLIKFVMNQRYGKSRYGEAIALAFGIVNDPHDECSITIKWQATMDKRMRGHKMPLVHWDDDSQPPRHLGWFNCRGEYVVPDK